MLKPTLLLLCGVMYVPGLAAIKLVLSFRAARRRSMPVLPVMAGTQWFRDDNGRVRWWIPGWAVFWFLAAVAVGLFVP